MAKVSVVITTMNRPTELRTALKSVLNQTYRELEVIVVIDGPDRPSQDVLLDVDDARLRTIVNSQNQGLAESRNIGIRAASTEWVAFLDDDDEWYPDKIQKQLRMAETMGGTHRLVVCKFLQKTPTVERIWPEALPETIYRFSEYLFCRRGMLLPSSYLVSRALMLDVPFTKGLRHIEDLDWLLRAANDPRTVVGGVPEALLIYNDSWVVGRESQNVSWKVSYTWGVNHRELFTPLAFSLYITKCVVPRAREARASRRELCHLLSAAIFLGSLNVKSVTFFVVSSLFSRESKRKARELLSARARKARFVASAAALNRHLPS